MSENVAEILTQRARLLAQRQPPQDEVASTFVWVRAYQENLLLDLKTLRRIEPSTAAVPLPLAPAGLRGLSYFRGEMVSVLDLGHILGLSQPIENGFLIFTRTDPVVAFQVTEIRDLLTFTEAEHRPYQGTSLYYEALSPQGYLFLNLSQVLQHPLIKRSLKESL